MYKLSALLFMAGIAGWAQQPSWVSNLKDKLVVDSRTYGGWVLRPTSPATLAIGDNLVTLKSVPFGVNWNDGDGILFPVNKHYLRVAGTGTPENCYIKSAGPGTAVGGATSGTVTLTCAGTHAAGYTLQSATGGILEAAYALGGVGAIEIPKGTISLYATLTLPAMINLYGQGTYASVIDATVGTAANPAIVIASRDATGEAVRRAGGRYSNFSLKGTGAMKGVWIGGDPAGVLAPAPSTGAPTYGWYSNYIKFDRVDIINFETAGVYFQAGNFVNFSHCNINNTTGPAVYVPLTGGGQYLEFQDTVLSTGTAGASPGYVNHAVVTMNPYTDIHFIGGQVSGALAAPSGSLGINWASVDTHYENNSTAPIIDVDNDNGGNTIKIVGGLMSLHPTAGGPPTFAYAIKFTGTPTTQVDLSLDHVTIQCDGGSVVTDFINLGPLVRGSLSFTDPQFIQAGTFTNVLTITGSAYPNMNIIAPLSSYAAGLQPIPFTGGGNDVKFPFGNFPIMQHLNFYGTTVAGGITSISGLWPGHSGTFTTSDYQTFTAGATIGNTISIQPGTIYTYRYDGTKLWITDAPIMRDITGAVLSNAKTVFGRCTLGTSCSVTFAGFSAWTSASSYFCACTDQDATAACRVVNTSATQMDITGTGTHVISYVCVGQ